MNSSISCLLFVLSSILLLSQQSYARKDLGGYWKNVMNDQPMPDAIRDLFAHQENEDQYSGDSKEKDHHFVRDFDMRPNVIIYHGAHHHYHDHGNEDQDLFAHQEHENQYSGDSKEKDHHFVRDFDMRPNVIIYHGAHHDHDNHQPEENKPLFKEFKPRHDMEPKEEASYIETVIHG